MIGVAAIALFLVMRFATPHRWPSDAIHVPRDAATLGLALERVSPGGTIVLHAQGPEIEGPITIDIADLTIGASGGAVEVRGEGASPAIAIQSDGVTLSGLAISGESIGLRIEGARCRVERITVRDVPIGIQLSNARGCELAGIEIEGAQTGLELVSARGNNLEDVIINGAAEYGMRVLASLDNTFDSVIVTDAPTGISVDQASMENEFADCRVSSSSVAGIHVRNSNDNLITGGDVRGSRVGIQLEAATGCEIRDSRVAVCDEAGILVQQAAQNRVIGNIISEIAGTGIELLQSGENALSYNSVTDCSGEGIRLERSDRTLVIGNAVSGSGYGLRILASDDCRVLRNDVAGTSFVGIFVSGGTGHRLLDNEILRGGVGMALDASENNTLLRNRIAQQTGMELVMSDTDETLEQAGIALALLNGSNANRVGANEMIESEIGLFLESSGRVDVTNNRIASCEQGVVLLRLGSGVRIEGNQLEENHVGLSHVEALGALDRSLTPVIANNVFAGNELADIQNLSDTTLYASGNWWGRADSARGSESAQVSGDVSLEESAWQGTVAVGTEIGTAHEILGRLVQSTLLANGFRVIDLVGMGDWGRVEQAVTARDVDLIWWGASAGDRVPGDEGETEAIEIPASRGWSAVVSAALAEQLPAPSLSSLAALAAETGESFRLTAPRAIEQNELQAALDAYGLQDAIGATDWTATQEEAEALLKFGVANIAIVDNLDETLTVGGFVALEDDLRVFSSAPMIIVLRRELIGRHPEIGEALSDLGSRLTTLVLHDLISRVRSLHQPPSDVAREFLLQQGFLGD